MPHDQLKRLQRNEQRYWEKVLGGHEKITKKLTKDMQSSGGRVRDGAATVESLNGMAKQLKQLRRKVRTGEMAMASCIAQAHRSHGVLATA